MGVDTIIPQTMATKHHTVTLLPPPTVILYPQKQGLCGWRAKIEPVAGGELSGEALFIDLWQAAMGINRWNAHNAAQYYKHNDYYPISIHSLAVALAVINFTGGWEEERRRQAITLAIMHDLHEAAWSGDIPAPVKAMLKATGSPIESWEMALDDAIFRAIAPELLMINDKCGEVVRRADIYIQNGEALFLKAGSKELRTADGADVAEDLVKVACTAGAGTKQIKNLISSLKADGVAGMLKLLEKDLNFLAADGEREQQQLLLRQINTETNTNNNCVKSAS